MGKQIDSRELNNFMKWVVEQNIEIPIEQFLFLAGLGDHENFHLFNFHTKLINQVKELADGEKKLLYDALHKFNDHFYFFFKDVDSLWGSILANYFLEGKNFREALGLIENFEKCYGSSPILTLMKNSCMQNLS